MSETVYHERLRVAGETLDLARATLTPVPAPDGCGGQGMSGEWVVRDNLLAAFKRHYNRARTDHIVTATPCPACGSPQGVDCRTVIDGVDTGWTHDARVFAHCGVRG